MNVLVAWCVVIASTCLYVPSGYCDNFDELRSKVVESDMNSDGVMDMRVETFWRGTNKVLQTLSHLKPSGLWSKTIYYLVGGHRLATEIDSDGDSIMETIVIQHFNQKDLEVFERDKQGTTKPASTEKVEVLKRKYAVLEDFWEKVDGTKSDNEVRRLMKDTQKRLAD